MTPIGALALLNYLILLISSAIGLATEGGLKAARRCAICAGVFVIVGFLIQFLMRGTCGLAAYDKNGAVDCPFGGNGMTGFNHNALYHILEILSKICLVAMARFLVLAEAEEGKPRATEDWPSPEGA